MDHEASISLPRVKSRSYNLGLNIPTTLRTAPILAYQPGLRPDLPCVYGPIEFREYSAVLVAIDGLLLEGGIEAAFVGLAAQEHAAALVAASAKVCATFARTSALALRCNIAREITGLAYREFAIRVADSSLLQWFLRIGEIDRVKAPSKSTLERFNQWASAPALQAAHRHLIAQAVSPASATAAQPLRLLVPVDATEIYFDSTCLKTNIHFPVDWVLLRDAARTLMKATKLIRSEGLKQRMPQEPLQFLSAINKLAMAMSAGNRRPDAKKQRKRTLRQMKTLEHTIARHARAHRDLLAAHQAETALSEKQAQVILDRIDQVLAQLPAAITQAHERIIGERPVPHAEKILSLYDDDVSILKRGKAGADVEFGNKLWLGETRAGLIIDYALLAHDQADTALVLPSVVRLYTEMKLPLQQVWGDRGLFSKANEKELSSLKIKSGLCPRDPAELQKRLQEDATFRAGLRRRGGTEARIAIFKQHFAGSPCRGKSFDARERIVGWAVLAHNLWVLARLKLTQDREAAQAVAG
jgi:IS5 family transposase